MLKMCLKKKKGVCLVEILIFFLRRHARLLMASLVMFQYWNGAFMQYENSDGWCILLKVQKIHATNVPEYKRQDKVCFVEIPIFF